MSKFNEMVEDEMGLLDEGLGKSLVTAGLVGAGVLGGVGALVGTSSHNREARTHQRVQMVSDATILARTLPITKWAEGYKAMVYIDSKGIPTIGYGFNLKAPHMVKELERLGYSQEELISGDRRIKETDAEVVLQRGLIHALQDAKKFASNWDQLDPTARMVVLDMAYNLGFDRLSTFKNFKAALEAEDYKTASDEMVDSDWYTDVGRRSRRLVKLMKHI